MKRGSRTVHPPSLPAWPDCRRPLSSPRLRSWGAGRWLHQDGMAGVGGGGEKVARTGVGGPAESTCEWEGCAPGRAAWPLLVVGPRAAGLGLRERRLRHKSLRVPPSSFLLRSGAPAPQLCLPLSSPPGSGLLPQLRLGSWSARSRRSQGGGGHPNMQMSA